MYHSKIILASKSPRRRQLLSYLFSNFNTLSGVEFSEPDPEPGMDAQKYVSLCVQAKLAQLSAQAKDKSFSPHDLVLVADTTVSVDGELLAKPADKKDSLRMLKRLSGREHDVFTAFYLGPVSQAGNASLIKISKSTVTFKKLNSTQMNWYVRSGEGLDKAGAYGFQGLGLQLIEKVQGSYTNIMGLPLEDLRQHADELKLR